MKSATASKPLATIHISLCAIAALFYAIADFGKTITKWYGIAMLFLLLADGLTRKFNKPFLSGLAILIATALQIVPAFNWLYWNGAHFSFLGMTCGIGAPGFVYHAFVFLTGALLLAKLRKTA
jgi:hypothetical protein